MALAAALPGCRAAAGEIRTAAQTCCFRGTPLPAWVMGKLSCMAILGTASELGFGNRVIERKPLDDSFP